MKRVQKMLAVCPVRMEHRLRLDVVQMPSSVSSEPVSMVVPGSGAGGHALVWEGLSCSKWPTSLLCEKLYLTR